MSTDTEKFTIEYKESLRGRWNRSKFARPMSFGAAEAMAGDLEEHGNTVRVVPWDKAQGNV